MFQHLDDPLEMPPASNARIRADMERGRGLRRRRRSLMVGLPFTAAAVIAVVVGTGAVSSAPSGDGIRGPAAHSPASSPAPPPPSPTPEITDVAEPADYECGDPAGDSSGEPDLSLVSLDRPAYPFVHYHWDGSFFPSEGTVEVVFRATSADGLRSRQLVVVVVDGIVESQFVRDPGTGERESLVPDAPTDSSVGGVPQHAVELSASSLGTSWPASAMKPLGDGWTWTASISVDSAVVDMCDATADPP